MRRLFWLMMLLLSACDESCVSSTECKDMCGERGVLVYQASGDGMCICNQAKP